MKNSQKGFTLIEILVVMAVGGMLMTGLVTAIFQTTGITMQSSAKITALEDIKNVAYWVSRDMKMASTADTTDGLALAWKTWYDEGGELDPLNPVSHSASYTLSVGEIQRNCDGDIITVGRYISSIEFSRDGNIITMTITSSPEGKAETAEQKTYHMYLQPKEDLS